MVGKVVIIGPAYPLRGGIANFNEALAQGFIDQGHAVSIYSFSLQYPSLFFPGKSQKDLTASPPKDVAIYNTINSVNPFSWATTANAVAAEAPSLVIVRYWMPFFAPALGTIVRKLKRQLKVPVVAITDNVIPHEKRLGDRMLTSFFVKPIDAFVAMSKSVMADLNSFNPRVPKAFLPHPIYNIFGQSIARNVALKNIDLPEGPRYILFFGIVRAYKGLDVLLEAMASVKDQNIKLIVAGEFYEDPQRYIDLIAQLGIEKQVILKNEYIPMDLVASYFCAADIVAQTYRTATQSGVTQIAYHFDVPMLVTDVGGLSEIVPDGKVGYVCPIEPPTIAAALTSYFERDRFAEFSANVKVEKQKYAWSKFVSELKELVKRID